MSNTTSVVQQIIATMGSTGCSYTKACETIGVNRHKYRADYLDAVGERKSPTASPAISIGADYPANISERGSDYNQRLYQVLKDNNFPDWVCDEAHNVDVVGHVNCIDDIMFAFVWSESPQGVNFWCDIFDGEVPERLADGDATEDLPKLQYVQTPSSIAFVHDNEIITIQSDHPHYDDIINAVKSGDGSAAFKMSSIRNAITFYQHGDVTVNVEEGTIDCKGRRFEVGSSLGSRILNDMMAGDVRFEKYVKFLDNLLDNPSTRVQRRVYDFLNAADITITDDGYILAYKVVQANYLDKYSGTIDNKVGTTVTMERSSVDDDDQRTCSHGLHLCSKSYISGFGSGDDRIVICKLNPRDVVSIPADYNDAKLRCCEYEVVAETTWDGL